MVTVGDRIQSVIDHMAKGKTELALSDVCIAVDITAQKYGVVPCKCSRKFPKNLLN